MSTSKVERKTVKSTPTGWAADLVWAASAYAYRFNNCRYLKTNEYDSETQLTRLSNRAILLEALSNPSVINDEDRKLGTHAQQWLEKTIIFKTLKNNLTPFDYACQTALSAIQLDSKKSNLELSIIASQISAYCQASRVDQYTRAIINEPLADCGKKVEVNITVIRSVLSAKYGVFFITAVTDCNHSIFFSYKESLPVLSCARIVGTVKAHHENSTQLNRVKLLQLNG